MTQLVGKATCKGPIKLVGVSYFRITKNGMCEDYNAAYQPWQVEKAIQAYNGFQKGNCIEAGYSKMVRPTQYAKV